MESPLIVPDAAAPVLAVASTQAANLMLTVRRAQEACGACPAGRWLDMVAASLRSSLADIERLSIMADQNMRDRRRKKRLL